MATYSEHYPSKKIVNWHLFFGFLRQSEKLPEIKVPLIKLSRGREGIWLCVQWCLLCCKLMFWKLILLRLRLMFLRDFTILGSWFDQLKYWWVATLVKVLAWATYTQAPKCISQPSHIINNFRVILSLIAYVPTF